MQWVQIDRLTETDRDLQRWTYSQLTGNDGRKRRIKAGKKQIENQTDRHFDRKRARHRQIQGDYSQLCNFNH